MDDPIFAIRYDPRKIKFETLPASLIKRCPELRGRYSAAWVYGHIVSTDAQYFIISGLMKEFDEETGTAKGSVHPDETGLIVAVRGSSCAIKAQDSFYGADDAPVWTLSESTLNDFASDTLRRYAAAFGGEKNFLERVPKNARRCLVPAMRN